MAGYRTAIISSLVFISVSFVPILAAEGNRDEGEPQDTVKADSLIVKESPADEKAETNYDYEDSSFIGPIDMSLLKSKIELYEPPEFMPYYESYISSKSLGDILRNRPGIFVLQHGSIGQPEMITKSEMLPGMQTLYNGIPVFHQGSYFPFRTGPDMNVLMSDNLSGIEITPLSYIALFSQGEMLSLESSLWPSKENLSSVTIAQGPFDYKKSAWRFSRLFSETIGATFTAGFNNSQGFYSSGADYSAFKINGSFVWRPQPNCEISYLFYQTKAKEGLVQFNRLIIPTLRSHNDLNEHTVNILYKHSDDLTLRLTAFRQHNYNRLYDDGISLNYLALDNIWGGLAAADYVYGKHNLKAEIGGKQHKLSVLGSQPILRTGSFLLSDSLRFSERQYAKLSARLRYDRLNNYQPAVTAVYGFQTGENSSAGLSAGMIDYEPDIYARYYSHPLIEPSQSDLVRSYQYQNNPDLESEKIYFGAADYRFQNTSWLSTNVALSAEKVVNDLIPVVSEIDSAWTSTEKNIDYKRLTGTVSFDYTLPVFFRGESGVTYFYYDPDKPLPVIKYSPALLAYSYGEFKVKNVLRDIDLSAAFQARYYAKRYYSGMVSKVFNVYQYDRAFVIDGSLAMRFGSFEFRIIEDNILDFLVGNDYSLWDDYSMPPGMVWWQFTWNFKN